MKQVEAAEVVIGNWGPARGVHHLGVVDRPGLHLVVGMNAGGKTFVGEGLEMLSGRAKVLDSIVTNGETEAFLAVGASRITIRKAPSGAEISRRTGEDPPRVAQIPKATRTLWTGDGLVGEETRARAMTRAVLEHCPVLVDDELIQVAIDAVLDATGENPWGDRLDMVAMGLANDHAHKVRGFKLPALSSPSSLRSQAEALVGQSVTALQDLVTGSCRAMVTFLGHCQSWQSEVVAKLNWDMDAAVSQAAELLEESAEAAHEALWQDRDVDDADRRLVAASAALERAKAALASAKSELGRTQELRTAHGEKPSRREVDEAERALDEAQGSVVSAESAVETLRSLIQKSRQLVDSARQSFENSVNGFLFDPASEPRLDQVIELARRLAEASKLLLEAPDLGSAEADLAASYRKREEAGAALVKARDSYQHHLARWEAVEEQLAKAPDQAWVADLEKDLEMRAAQFADAGREKSIALLSRSYRLASAERGGQAEILNRMASLEKAFKAASKASLAATSELTTRRIGLPWLRLDGSDIWVAFTDDGALAENAAAENAINWRPFDEGRMVSTAERNEVVLAVMLSSLEKPGSVLAQQWRWVDWELVAAFDDKKIKAISRRFKDACLIAISERPWREGTPEELHIEYVDPDGEE